MSIELLLAIILGTATVIGTLSILYEMRWRRGIEQRLATLEKLAKAPATSSRGNESDPPPEGASLQ